MLPTIFCPQCQAYVGPSTEHCPACGQESQASVQLPEPGQPLWRGQSPGAALARPVVDGERIYFSWGARHASGGVVCLDRHNGEEIWSFQTSHAVEGGLSKYGEKLYLGTLGFLGGGAKLYCLKREDGKEVWQKDLSGGAWSAPLLSEARVYVGTDDGRLHCIDNRSGEPVSQYQPLQLETGRMWLAWVDGCLLALSQSGQVMAVNPSTMKPLWHQPLDAGWGISSAPTVVGEKVFFGGSGGKVLRLDFRKKKIDIFADGFNRVVASPGVVEGLLFVGAHDHYLHAFDLQTGLEKWKGQEFAHAIAASTFAADDLVAVAVNQCGVCLLDAGTGDQIWEFRPPEDVKLFSDVIIDSGVIYFGTDNGALCALPWHLGQYEWAADYLQTRAEYFSAAICYVVAAHLIIDLSRREHFLDQAEVCWDKSGEPEWAAFMWEGLGRERKAAQAYCRAAEARRGQDKLAAEYYYRASRLYWRLGEQEKADQCLLEAATLGKWPRIRLFEWNNPQMVQGKPGRVSFRAENFGYGDAKNLYFTLGGSLLQPVDCKVLQPMPPDSYFEMTLDIIPTRIKSDLKVEIQYVEDENRKVPFTATLDPPMQIEAKKRKIVEVGDIVGGKLRVVNNSNEEVEIKVGDQVMSEVEIIFCDDEDSPDENLPNFVWPEFPRDKQVEEQSLIQVRVVNEQITVPSASWAIFLADEAAIATVAPGRHQRKKYPPLRSKLGESHKPVWKAVIFSGSPFRLFYRWGPLRTQEGAQIGVECGLTAEFDERKPFDLWKGILGDREQLDTTQLAAWLQGQVKGTLEKWLASQAEESLSPGFAHRESVMLNLLEELRETHDGYGICLIEPIWWLNFVNPKRNQLDDLREKIYWQKMEQAVNLEQNTCPGCGAIVITEGKYCDQCGREY
jgi:outer membrane protein assembly factor BamB